MKKYSVGIIGATGMVGQRFLTLLQDHPWFDVTTLAASARSAGRSYKEAVEGRWAFDWAIPEKYVDMPVMDAADLDALCDKVDFVFCAVDMPKDQIRALEEAVAKRETPVVSNNSANRWTPDVPVFVPEVNSDHAAIIPMQRKRLGTTRGFITAKPRPSAGTASEKMTSAPRSSASRRRAKTAWAIPAVSAPRDRTLRSPYSARWPSSASISGRLPPDSARSYRPRMASITFVSAPCTMVSAPEGA